ncbi:MAG: uroporphyrinogen-III C-methyltransferase [Bacteroidota bacterium]
MIPKFIHKYLKAGTRSSNPKIILLGAGPGDPELISVKGLKALQRARVILYDALVSEDLLEEAPLDCIKIYVGKRASFHSYKQEEINEMLVQFARQYGEVIRLKGGDPFIFGRGHEELEHATNLGVEVEIIPGISSCTSIPALQKVPLTRRGMNESFWVTTACTRKGELSGDLALAARSSSSVMILMGIRKLAEISRTFHLYRSSQTPIMIVQNGSRSQEKFVLGNLENIVEKAREANISTPGIIMIGEVIRLHPAYVEQAQKMASVKIA